MNFITGLGSIKRSKRTNVAKQVIVSHHGLKGIGNRNTIIHVHQGQGLFVLVAGSNLIYTMGIFTPVFFANAFASGYPASTCRATPSPGSFVSTRSMRFAISFVPSATVTCPACCEYPIPTPPPLCIDTHDAPLAVLISAFSNGQSATASEPSRIASVSRYGDATEPQSR